MNYFIVFGSLISVPFLLGINLFLVPLSFALKKKGLVKWHQFVISSLVLSVVLGVPYAILVLGASIVENLIAVSALGIAGALFGLIWWYLLVCKVGVSHVEDNAT